MTNLAHKLSFSDRLIIAHKALKKATEQKLKYTVEDYQDSYDDIQVGYFDNADEYHEESIHRALLVEFVREFYSTTVDEFFNGRHLQYEDPAHPSDYLDENLKEVLTDYLNNRRVKC
jgi:hypothetical protein